MKFYLFLDGKVQGPCLPGEISGRFGAVTPDTPACVAPAAAGTAVEWRPVKFYPELFSCLKTTPERTKQRPPALKILSTDDDANIRALLWGLLSEAGHTVEFAKDGEEVFRRLSERCYDLVILDVNMPKMNGYKVSELLHEKLPEPPKVIIFTGRDLETERLQFVCSGADAILNKGSGNEKILKTIEDLFSGDQVEACSPREVAAEAGGAAVDALSGASNGAGAPPPLAEDTGPRQVGTGESPENGKLGLTIAGLIKENGELKAGLTDIKRILGHIELEYAQLEEQSEKRSLKTLAICREFSGKLEAECRGLRSSAALVVLFLLVLLLGFVLRMSGLL
jgi:CheY-like chemotaxis protein